jgi:predicted transcriptional regulator
VPATRLRDDAAGGAGGAAFPGLYSAVAAIFRIGNLTGRSAARTIPENLVLRRHDELLIFLHHSDVRKSVMGNSEQSSDLLALTTEIVAAHVSNNTVALGDLPQLINQVYNSLANIGTAPAAPAARPQPAVSIKRSVQPDYIVCLEDGKKLKMLKRHLKTAYNMSPEAYRERWGLPPDYPMVAPNYARQRSRLAKEIGLGTRARRVEA